MGGPPRRSRLAVDVAIGGIAGRNATTNRGVAVSGLERIGRACQGPLAAAALKAASMAFPLGLPNPLQASQPVVASYPRFSLPSGAADAVVAQVTSLKAAGIGIQSRIHKSDRFPMRLVDADDQSRPRAGRRHSFHR